MRPFTILASSIGLLLCLGAAGTGLYWGVWHKEDMKLREIHLDLAIACVFVSMVAHSLSIHMLRKAKS